VNQLERNVTGSIFCICLESQPSTDLKTNESYLLSNECAITYAFCPEDDVELERRALRLTAKAMWPDLPTPDVAVEMSNIPYDRKQV